jgi:hypothetical protein
MNLSDGLLKNAFLHFPTSFAKDVAFAVTNGNPAGHSRNQALGKCMISPGHPWPGQQAIEMRISTAC